MSGTMLVDRIPFMPEVWMVPATLADLECPHGELGGCEQCELEAELRLGERSRLEGATV